MQLCRKSILPPFAYGCQQKTKKKATCFEIKQVANLLSFLYAIAYVPPTAVGATYGCFTWGLKIRLSAIDRYAVQSAKLRFALLGA